MAHSDGFLGRHAFGTISGIFDAYKQLPRARRAAFRTHLTMLDIHDATIARDLCMLILLEDLAHADEPHVRDEIKVTLMYMFLVPIMPNYCYTRCVYRRSRHVHHSFACSLRKVMETIRARLSVKTPNLPEWLHVNQDAVPGVLRALDYWLTTPKSTKRTISLHEHKHPEDSNRELERDALRTSNSELKRKILETRADERRQLKASLRAMTGETIISQGLPFVPRGASPRQARALLEENIESVLDVLQRSYKNGRITGYEESWYGRVKVLLPPQGYMGYHVGFKAAWDQLKRDQRIDESALVGVSRHSPYLKSSTLSLY